MIPGISTVVAVRFVAVPGIFSSDPSGLPWALPGDGSPAQAESGSMGFPYAYREESEVFIIALAFGKPHYIEEYTLYT